MSELEPAVYNWRAPNAHVLNMLPGDQIVGFESPANLEGFETKIVEQMTQGFYRHWRPENPEVEIPDQRTHWIRHKIEAGKVAELASCFDAPLFSYLDVVGITVEPVDFVTVDGYRGKIDEPFRKQIGLPTTRTSVIIGIAERARFQLTAHLTPHDDPANELATIGFRFGYQLEHAGQRRGNLPYVSRCQLDPLRTGTSTEDIFPPPLKKKAQNA